VLFADAVAARQFGERGTFGASAAALVLLRLGQFRFPAHALNAVLRPTAALGRPGADKISLDVGRAAENRCCAGSSSGASCSNNKIATITWYPSPEGIRRRAPR